MRINAEIIDRVASTSPGFVSASVHRSTGGRRVFNPRERATAAP